MAFFFVDVTEAISFVLLVFSGLVGIFFIICFIELADKNMLGIIFSKNLTCKKCRKPQSFFKKCKHTQILLIIPTVIAVLCAIALLHLVFFFIPWVDTWPPVLIVESEEKESFTWFTLWRDYGEPYFRNLLN